MPVLTEKSVLGFIQKCEVNISLRKVIYYASVSLCFLASLVSRSSGLSVTMAWIVANSFSLDKCNLIVQKTDKKGTSNCKELFENGNTKLVNVVIAFNILDSLLLFNR